MQREVTITGETIEKAVAEGLRQLGIPETEGGYEILQKPVKKTFGLFGGAPAKVRVYVRKKRPAEMAAAYMQAVIEKMGVIDPKVEIREETETTSELQLSGENIRLIIGHRGDTLDALQYLACLVANTEKQGYHRVTLDVGEFRSRRKETLEDLGRKLAHRALRTGKACVLEPMNPYDRRIIHGVVREIPGALSWSEGRDKHRHMVIAPENSDRARKAMRKLAWLEKKAAQSAGETL